MGDIFRHNDPAKGVMEMSEVEGFVLPKAAEAFLQGRTLEQQVEGVRNLPIRDDDIILCAYAKSGNVLINLQTVSQDRTVQHSDIISILHSNRTMFKCYNIKKTSYCPVLTIQ